MRNSLSAGGSAIPEWGHGVMAAAHPTDAMGFHIDRAWRPFPAQRRLCLPDGGGGGGGPPRGREHRNSTPRIAQGIVCSSFCGQSLVGVDRVMRSVSNRIADPMMQVTHPRAEGRRPSRRAAKTHHPSGELRNGHDKEAAKFLPLPLQITSHPPACGDSRFKCQRPQTEIPPPPTPPNRLTIPIVPPNHALSKILSQVYLDPRPMCGGPRIDVSSCAKAQR